MTAATFFLFMQEFFINNKWVKNGCKGVQFKKNENIFSTVLVITPRKKNFFQCFKALNL